MKKFLAKTLFCTSLVCALLSCRKSDDQIRTIEPPDPPPSNYTLYVINRGNHYCQQSTLLPTEYGELKFSVKFDSSAIYSTISAENQYDVNKLYGFSDNGGVHQEFSARIGWRWSEGALRLFGYTHNNGEINFQELSPVSIGQEHECSIKVTGNNYHFSVDGKSVTMARGSNSPLAQGYKLFPYFGGDETAPHDIQIWIREKN